MAIQLLAAFLSILAIATLACGQQRDQPSEATGATDGAIYIIAKDKATGDIIDVTKYSDVRQSGSCEKLARESAAVNANLEFYCEERRLQVAGVTNTPAPTEYSYLIEYNLENGRYSAERVSGSISHCEQLAAESREAAPDSTFMCQEEIQSSAYDGYGIVLHRIGDQYFVGGVQGNQTRGKLITKDDVDTIIKYADCLWDTPLFINELRWTDDQNEDDTVRRLMNMVPFEKNLIRDMRLVLRHSC